MYYKVKATDGDGKDKVAFEDEEKAQWLVAQWNRKYETNYEIEEEVYAARVELKRGREVMSLER